MGRWLKWSVLGYDNVVDSMLIEQKSAYPNDGQVSITVRPEQPTRFRLLLRIPTWTSDRFVPGELYQYVSSHAEPVNLSVNGDPVTTHARKGFAIIDRQWKAGDQVSLELPMPLHASKCHPSVAANRNRIALTRGPFVLCAEGVDNGGPTQRFYFEGLPDTSKAEVTTTAIDSGSFIQVCLPASAVTKDGATEPVNLVLTPYYAWNNRGISSMSVWFPREKSQADCGFQRK